MATKLYSQEEELRRMLPTDFTAMLYRRDAKEDDLHIYLNIGPIRRSEAASWMMLDQSNYLHPQSAIVDYKSMLDNIPALSGVCRY